MHEGARSAEKASRRERLLAEAEALGHTGTWEHDLVTGEIFHSGGLKRLFFGDRHTELDRVVDHEHVIHPDDRERVKRRHEQLIASGEQTDIEYRVVWPDGSVHHVCGRTRVVRDASGKPIRMVGTNADVTEQRRAEEQLARRACQQAAVAQLGMSALLGGDMQALFDETVSVVVRTFDVDFCKVMELMPDGATLVMRAGAGPWAPGAVGHARVPATTGHMGWFALNASAPVVVDDQRTDTRFAPCEMLLAHEIVSGAVVPIHGRTRPWGVLGAHMKTTRRFTEDDLSFLSSLANLLGTALERLRAEDELRQAQKLEAVGLLAGGIAHDFNNILSVIMSSAALLRDDVGESGAARENVDDILIAGERAAALTRQLLTFSRRDVTTQTQLLDLNDVVADMERMLRRIAGEAIQIITTPGASCGLVCANRGHVEQILVNLVVNARDAMPGGGKVTIETASDGHDVVLAVGDEGVGMDERTRARIFEPFFTTKEAGKGTGLGLSTVFGIVRQAGGSVDVRSALGRGTRFEIRLPRASGAAAHARASMPPARTANGSETVLLVEDDDQIRTVTRNVLRRRGYQVLEAPNAGEALLICERHPGTIDLLLTDVVLPHTSGPEIAQRLASLRPDMKVLFMSGYASEAIVESLRSSKRPLLPKPFTPDLLTSKIREVLDAGGEFAAPPLAHRVPAKRTE
jgi:PAS domain S-box-containing protein